MVSKTKQNALKFSEFPVMNSYSYGAPIKTPKFIAYCSESDSNIDIININTKKEYSHFQGATLSLGENPWSHVKEIPNSGLLCSLNHDYLEAAVFKLFDISQQNKARELFSTYEIEGIVGHGFIAYNAKRNILGVIPVGGKISYHLLTLDCGASYGPEFIKLSRKSKWFSQFTNGIGLENTVDDLDFELEGLQAAAIDSYGTCLISNIETNKCISYFRISDQRGGYTNKCRWMSQVSNSHLFVKFDFNLLNVLDIEKRVQVLKVPIQLEENEFGETSWIDVCPSNNNLLATAGEDNNIKIFDRLKSKVVRTINPKHSGAITCVRWSPNGEQLLTASYDGTVRLIDFKTGKVLSIAHTEVEKYAFSACFLSTP